MDRHSSSVADKVYAALSSRKQAKLSAFAYTRIMGEPVKLPTDAEWRRDGPSIRDILKRADTTLPTEDDLAEVEEDFGAHFEIGIGVGLQTYVDSLVKVMVSWKSCFY